MSNGFSDKEMITMILEGQGKIQEQINGLVNKVDRVIQHGCAHREGDLDRIKELESWRTRGIVGVIGLAIGLVVEFILGATQK